MLKSFRFQAVAVAGLLLLAPLAGAAVGAQQKAPSKPPAKEENQQKRERGAEDMADGQIKNVTCKGRALDMDFDDSYEILHLHTDNYFKVDFKALDFTPKGIMNPCKTVKGMWARVYYYHIKGHPLEGELISVELRK